MKEKKIIITLTVFILLFSFFTVACYATEEVGGLYENTDTVTDTEVTENGDTLPDTKEEVTEQEKIENDSTGTGANFFDTVFNEIKGYTGEIFSLLALISSLILAYAYKSGLLPLVKNGLSILTGTVAKLKESADKSKESTEYISGALKDRLAVAEDIISKLSDNIDLLEKSLTEEKKRNDEGESLKLIMSAQIDLLYDVFMTSSLPQYQKDAMGMRVQKMREALGKNEAS